MKPASAVATPVEWERTMEADTLCPEAALVATVSTAHRPSGQGMPGQLSYPLWEIALITYTLAASSA